MLVSYYLDDEDSTHLSTVECSFAPNIGETVFLRPRNASTQRYIVKDRSMTIAKSQVDGIHGSDTILVEISLTQQ
jgi:hypothetical protein